MCTMQQETPLLQLLPPPPPLQTGATFGAATFCGTTFRAAISGTDVMPTAQLLLQVAPMFQREITEDGFKLL